MANCLIPTLPSTHTSPRNSAQHKVKGMKTVYDGFFVNKGRLETESCGAVEADDDSSVLSGSQSDDGDGGGESGGDGGAEATAGPRYVPRHESSHEGTRSARAGMQPSYSAPPLSSHCPC